MASRNYIESYHALRGDSNLPKQCEGYILTSAIPAIYAGSPADPASVAWADLMVANPNALAHAVRVLAIYCVGNSTIREAIGAGDSAEDSDVEYVGATYLSTLIALDYRGV